MAYKNAGKIQSATLQIHVISLNLPGMGRDTVTHGCEMTYRT